MTSASVGLAASLTATSLAEPVAAPDGSLTAAGAAVSCARSTPWGNADVRVNARRAPKSNLLITALLLIADPLLGEKFEMPATEQNRNRTQRRHCGKDSRNSLEKSRLQESATTCLSDTSVWSAC